jgi:hypothetical protein
MANPQLYPLEVNARTGEPFLRLNNHKNIILTPHRPSDVQCYPPILNDPRVYEWVLTPVNPYLPGESIFQTSKLTLIHSVPQNMATLGFHTFRPASTPF